MANIDKMIASVLASHDSVIVMIVQLMHGALQDFQILIICEVLMCGMLIFSAGSVCTSVL